MKSCWAHAGISTKQKLQIYRAVVLSKLMYNLETLWLLQADKQRLDAFHCKCLRLIIGILPSYFSRVSNVAVLEQAGEHVLSKDLEKHQVNLFDKIVTLHSSSPLRERVLTPGTSEPRKWTDARKRGRPKQQWAACVHRLWQESELH